MLRTKIDCYYTVHYDDTDISESKLNQLIHKVWKSSKHSQIIVDVTWDFLNDNYIFSVHDFNYNFIEDISFPA